MNNYYKSLKIIFAGTPHFAAYHLKYLISSHHQVISILTQPDRPNQRNKKIIESPIKIIGQKYNIPIIQVNNFYNEKKIKNILPKIADIIVVVAYGIIFPDYLLNFYPMGCINIHASLLPQWRGPAPIQWSILNNDVVTGITIIKMNQKVDAGNILYQIPCILTEKENIKTVIKKLCSIGVKALFQTLIQLQKKKYLSITQNHHQATYTKKITKKYGKINFLMTAKHIETMIRTLNPWPSTYININNHMIKIHYVQIIKSKKKWKPGQIILIQKDGIFIQTKQDILKIIKIQIPGKKITHISDFINSKQKIFITGNILK